MNVAVPQIGRFRFYRSIVLPVVLLLTLLFAPAALTQDQSASAQNFHQWGSLTLFNGLPSNSVRSIAQTPDGVMWFGTDSGLARFDGRQMQTVALGEDETGKILALKVSSDGTLWIGTSAGAFVYRNNRTEPIKNVGGQPVSSILAGERVTLVTRTRMLYQFLSAADTDTGPQYVYEYSGTGHPPEAPFTFVAETTLGLIVGTYGEGSLKFDGKTFTQITRRPLFVNTVASDTGGNIWLGADSGGGGSGLYVLRDGGGTEKIGGDLGDVLSIDSDTLGETWVGTGKSGLFHLHGIEPLQHFTFENTAGGLRSNTIYAVFVDREGVIWAGTNRGVCRFDGSSPFIQTLSDNANSNFVRTFYRTGDGRTFAGTNSGVYLLTGEKWSELAGFRDKTVYAIAEDANRRMLIGGPRGIFDSSGKQLLEGDIRAFASFNGKTYAAIFERGLIAIDDPKSPPVFSGTTPTALFAAPDKIWIGTADGGVFSFDGREAKREPGFESLAHSAIWRIASGDNGSLWIASSRGLYRYANGELSQVIPNYDVRYLIADDTGVWAATVNGGLLHVGQDELYGWIISDLNVEQGLPSQQVFSLLKRDKRLLIGTNRGIVNYLPGQVKPNVVISRVLSRRLHDADEWGKTIELEYPQNSLLVEVAGESSRTFPEQFQYAFVLKNAAGELIEKRLTHDAQFSPSNLRPGEYSIEARSFNKDLLFSEPIIIRFFIARAPFPRTATALGGLLFVALIALVWAVAERKRIGQRNRELAAARFDLTNEAERERRRIAGDLHDQTLADLRNLMMISDEVAPGNTRFRAEIESVSTEIRRICEDLSPSVLENVGLVAALEFLLSHTIDDYRFEAAEDLEGRIAFPLNVQLQIYRIGQEVLTNIKRHSTATIVEMNLSVSETGEFLMEIVDNGGAFEPTANTPTGRGIANIRSRGSLINAEIYWRSGVSGGTEFSLRKQAN